MRSRSDKFLPLGRVGQAKAVRHGAVLKRIAQFVGASCPRLADHVYRVWRRAVCLGPFEQHHRDGLVKLLVRRLRRPEDVVIESSVGDTIKDRPACFRLTPVGPGNQHCAPGVGV